MLVMVTLLVFVSNLAICEPGQRLTDQFDLFGVELSRCDWDKLSTEMRRMYLIFLSDTQQYVNLKSYGGFACTRNTFKKVFYRNLKNMKSVDNRHNMKFADFHGCIISHFQIINNAFSNFMTFRKFGHF